jgi:hypothetical protein
MSGTPPPAEDDPVRQRHLRTRRFEMLLAATVSSFVVQGMVPPSAGQEIVVTALVGVSLLLTGAIRCVVAAALAGLALSVLHAVTDRIGDGAVHAMNAALILIAPPAVAVGVIREIRISRRVRLPAVLGVLALYLLIGMLFGFVYAALDRLGGAPFFADGASMSGSRALYFSFTTLTTVGYGDFTARSDVGHTLAAFEALVGQVYLVTVVAAIVGNLRRPASDAS